MVHDIKTIFNKDITISTKAHLVRGQEELPCFNLNAVKRKVFIVIDKAKIFLS